MRQAESFVATWDQTKASVISQMGRPALLSARGGYQQLNREPRADGFNNHFGRQFPPVCDGLDCPRRRDSAARGKSASRPRRLRWPRTSEAWIGAAASLLAPSRLRGAGSISPMALGADISHSRTKTPTVRPP